MKKLFLFLALSVAACGSDDTLNQLPQDEAQPGEVVTVVFPGGEMIPAVVSEVPEEPAESDPDLDCPEEYAIADLVIESCLDSMGLIAEGEGCLKSLRMMTEEEHDEYCAD